MPSIEYSGSGSGSCVEDESLGKAILVFSLIIVMITATIYLCLNSRFPSRYDRL